MLRVVSANHELKFIKCTRAACKLEKLELSYHLQLHALSFCIPRVGQYNATYYIRLQKNLNKNFDMQQNFHTQTVEDNIHGSLQGDNTFCYTGLIGVSLSEPHTSVVYRTMCIDQPTD